MVLMQKKIIGLIAVSLLLLVVLAGCVKEKATSANELQKFKSYDELVVKFRENRQDRQYGVFETALSIGAPLAATGAVKSAASSADATASTDYSRTNVQVEGVDEADIVKTDGKYIYNVTGNMLAITDAFPVETAQIVSVTDLNDLQPLELFIKGDRLLLFGNAGAYSYGGYSRYYYYGGSKMTARLYDISDKSKPVVLKELAFDGSYLTSRLIGSNAYFVVNSYPVYEFLDDIVYNEENRSIIPLMYVDGVPEKIAAVDEIGFIYPMPIESFVTIASLNLESMELKKETIAGNAENVFASLDNIYMASTAWLPEETPETADANESQGIPVAKELGKAVVGIAYPFDSEKEVTVINKFNLSDGTIGFVGQGIVPGRVLNQFSMDEFEGNFRIAITEGRLSRSGSQTRNNLYVLGEDMNRIGSLEDLAPGESIYSARFMGKKAYLVTFKKVDPLFVIDLSEPAEPKVVGKLKIPGFSDYLHPIDETHLIGVGKETIESAYGDFAWYQGMKLAVFDVSDVENPVEMHKVVIGDRGTDSYALRDHKAFLYDKEKELLVLPIMLAEIPEAEKQKTPEERGDFPAYGEPVFQGAFVYRLTLENGFEEKGRITHVTKEDELKRGYYFGDDYQVLRALFIDSVLYTLSDRMLKANDLQSLAELKEFKFPVEKTPVPSDVVIIE
ncbi:beta-propeller domain-containing protein [archaeon]|nr:beta-propeller domain-containing protein [archaeon]